MADPSLFPDGFLWGAAVSAYQVEGSPLADGAGPSNWHRFSHTPGLVHSGDTGDVACDQYRRYRADVRLMRRLGLNAYRFSVSWSRILPDGTGRVNRRGLDHYERLVDELLESGITPFLTLFHWDLPAALEDRGGWLNPDIAGWFADYAQVLFRALDGRVRFWTTLNEPWVVTDGGYLHGKLAPGHRDVFETPIAARNLMRAHAAAVRAYRARGRHAIGIVVNIEPKYPASRRRADLDATARADAYMNRQYLDPMLLGRSPREMKDVFGEAWLGFGKADLAEVREPVDFVGVNYYQRSVVENDRTALPVRASGVPQAGATHTETGWEVFPPGLTDTLLWLKRRYGDLPFYVTENGAAFYDPPRAKGEVADPLRVAYLADHLRAAREAIRRGVDLRGYFVWSFLDNFEWSHGYSKRFGIVHVDYATQKRTPKASARFYAEVIRTNGAALDEPRGAGRDLTPTGSDPGRSRVPAARGSRARPKRTRPRGR
ncbi:MAG TPA: GH1 family beta-glucosidase [Thermoanaerobaculia bacterium]|nr:GH1 family beta-glucosidase [Thermoanaerobaculia bacterium]